MPINKPFVTAQEFKDYQLPNQEVDATDSEIETWLLAASRFVDLSVYSLIERLDIFNDPNDEFPTSMKDNLKSAVIELANYWMGGEYIGDEQKRASTFNNGIASFQTEANKFDKLGDAFPLTVRAYIQASGIELYLNNDDASVEIDPNEYLKKQDLTTDIVLNESEVEGDNTTEALNWLKQNGGGSDVENFSHLQNDTNVPGSDGRQVIDNLHAEAELNKTQVTINRNKLVNVNTDGNVLDTNYNPDANPNSFATQKMVKDNSSDLPTGNEQVKDIYEIEAFKTGTESTGTLPRDGLVSLWTQNGVQVDSFTKDGITYDTDAIKVRLHNIISYAYPTEDESDEVEFVYPVGEIGNQADGGNEFFKSFNVKFYPGKKYYGRQGFGLYRKSNGELVVQTVAYTGSGTESTHIKSMDIEYTQIRYKGVRGLKGDTGEKGIKGDTGVEGAQGPQGQHGNLGDTGPQGQQGIQGPRGTQGAQGIQGEQGNQGVRGNTGDPGPGLKTYETPDFQSFTQTVALGNVDNTEKVLSDLEEVPELTNSNLFIKRPGSPHVLAVTDKFREQIYFNPKDTYIEVEFRSPGFAGIGNQYVKLNLAWHTGTVPFTYLSKTSGSSSSTAYLSRKAEEVYSAIVKVPRTLDVGGGISFALLSADVSRANYYPPYKITIKGFWTKTAKGDVGDKGEKGDRGLPGTDGVTPTLSKQSFKDITDEVDNKLIISKASGTLGPLGWTEVEMCDYTALETFTKGSKTYTTDRIKMVFYGITSNKHSGTNSTEAKALVYHNINDIPLHALTNENEVLHEVSLPDRNGNVGAFNVKIRYTIYRKNNKFYVRFFNSEASGSGARLQTLDISLFAIKQVGVEVIAGPKGPAGADGTDGIKGDKGDRGDTGPDGPRGIQGIEGPQGTSGLIGPKGDDGNQGIQGVKGDTGNAGPTGAQGNAGIQGPAGADGPQGPKGDKGDRGEQGLPGDNPELDKHIDYSDTHSVTLFGLDKSDPTNGAFVKANNQEVSLGVDNASVITVLDNGTNKATTIDSNLQLNSHRIGGVSPGVSQTDAINVQQLTDAKTSITENTTNIATNTTNISGNTTDIDLNNTEIGTNATNIDTNKTNIANQNIRVLSNEVKLSNVTDTGNVNDTTYQPTINPDAFATQKMIADNVGGSSGPIFSGYTTNELSTDYNNQTSALITWNNDYTLPTTLFTVNGKYLNPTQQLIDLALKTTDGLWIKVFTAGRITATRDNFSIPLLRLCYNFGLSNESFSTNLVSFSNTNYTAYITNGTVVIKLPKILTTTDNISIVCRDKVVFNDTDWYFEVMK